MTNDTQTLYDAHRKPSRRCGDCQLCCRLLPISELDKPALKRCQHQRHGKGCSIYARRPMSCEMWSCRWLVDEACASLPRPDRAHYVVDTMPDFVTAKPDDSAPSQDIPVIVVWADPDHRDAHKAPGFRAWLDAQRMPALIRYGRSEAFLLAPPSVTGDGWVENSSTTSGPEHTLQQKAAALGGVLKVEIDSGHGTGIATMTFGDKAVPVAFQGKTI